MNFEYEENRIYANDENGNLIAEITFPPVSDDTVIIPLSIPRCAGRALRQSLCVPPQTKSVRQVKKPR